MKGLSIRHKLMLIITLTSILALVSMGVVILVIDWNTTKNTMYEQYLTIARILAEQNTATLSFDDEKTARNTLRSLAAEHSVTNACLYNDKGILFAEYATELRLQCEKRLNRSRETFTSDYLSVYQDVILNEVVIGAVFLRVSLRHLNERLLQTLSIVLVLVITVSLVALLISHYLQRIISNPVLKLANIARNISERGDYDIPIVNHRDDEIGRLYSAFSDMLEQIRSREQARDAEEKRRRESEAQVRLLLESTAEAIYGVDRLGRCTIVNSACLKMLGYESRESFIRQNDYSSVFQDGEQRERSLLDGKKIYQVIITGEGLHVDCETVQRKNDAPLFVEYWVYPITAKVGVVGAVVTFVDISRRKEIEFKLKKYQDHLEDMVDQRTEEIKMAYKELEAFSYSVSHDLRAPLRTIDGFSHILVEDYGSKLDDSGRNYLTRIRNGAQRMAQLIDDLLNLSQAMRGDVFLEEIDLTAQAEEIISEFKLADTKHKINFQASSEMKVVCDPRLMRVALQNLLSNAWKYSSKRETIDIEFGQEVEGGERVYYVKDNGAGFDMHYVDKLFHAFQRLHGPEEFPGTGIGLATVQRIIRRHGGRIWAHSVQNEGATFFFTLPSSTRERITEHRTEGLR